MAQLDARKLDILKKMGIDVWCYRDPPTVPKSASESMASVQIDSVQSQSEQRVSDVLKVEQAESFECEAIPALTLDVVMDKIRACHDCELSKTRNNAVPGHGNPAADWVFVGNAPCDQEDIKGLPFVDDAGQMLDSIIKALGLDRSGVFITNGVKCRPPEDRNPLPEEVSQCSHYLHEQLEFLKPKVIVALGLFSAQMLLDSQEPMHSLRQIIHSYGDRQVPLIATYHPDHLLKNPSAKSEIWEDLLMARSMVES